MLIKLHEPKCTESSISKFAVWISSRNWSNLSLSRIDYTIFIKCFCLLCTKIRLITDVPKLSKFKLRDSLSASIIRRFVYCDYVAGEPEWEGLG